MASTYGRLTPANTQLPPIVSELEAIFRQLPDDELLTKLQGPNRRGPKGYSVRSMWRAFVAFYYLGLPSVSDLVRYLQDNPYVARACGFEEVPSQPTFSRFVCRLAKQYNMRMVKNVMRGLVRELFAALPNFGESVAIDATDIKAWSNGIKGTLKGTNGRSDRHAGWVAKRGTNGHTKYVWGYKVHLLVDTAYELPIMLDVTAGNVHDSTRATPLLSQAIYTQRNFHPKVVVADSAYSGQRLHDVIRKWYHAKPIIDPHPTHKKAKEYRDYIGTEWKGLYARRSAIERVNSRLKAFRRLDHVRVRGRMKLWVHSIMSVMVMQALALATGAKRSVRAVA